MRPTWGGTFLVLGASVAAIAITTPYRYGAWQDPSAAMAVGGLTLNYGAGLQSALMHVSKVCFVTAIVPAWRRSTWAGAICAVVCIPLMVLSVWNAVALLALQRSTRVTEVRSAIERAESLSAELDSIGARLALVGWKSLATVEAEIAAERHHWLWEATSGCTKLVSGGQRQYCARLARLEGARGVAIEAERLRTRESELRLELTRQPRASENRQADLALLAEWLGISLDIAEILRTLLWAGVVEIAEIAAFGFAGFFWSSKEERTATLKAGHEAPSATTEANREPPPPPESRHVSKRDRGPKKPSRNTTSRCASQPSQPQAKRCSAPRDEDEERRAVDRFVAMLSRGRNLRVAGSALCAAYERVREQRGWPKIPSNVFGQLVKPAVEAVGGRKVKASRQFYAGVSLPPMS